MPGNEQGLRPAAEALAEALKTKGLSGEAVKLMELVDHAEELDPLSLIYLNDFLYHTEIIPLHDAVETKEAFDVLLSLVATLMKELVTHEDHLLLTEEPLPATDDAGFRQIMTHGNGRL